MQEREGPTPATVVVAEHWLPLLKAVRSALAGARFKVYAQPDDDQPAYLVAFDGESRVSVYEPIGVGKNIRCVEPSSAPTFRALPVLCGLLVAVCGLELANNSEPHHSMPPSSP